jgi:hypothetical protein
MYKKIFGILLCTLFITGYFSCIINVNAEVSCSEKHPRVNDNILNDPPVITKVGYQRFPVEGIIVIWSDNENDDVKIGISWDNDMNVDVWSDFESSPGSVFIESEGKKGTVGVIAEDINGARSDWSLLKSKEKSIESSIFNFLLEKMFNRFPFLEKILNQIIL